MPSPGSGSRPAPPGRPPCRLFDARASLGPDRRLGCFQRLGDPGALLEAMDRLGIGKALVRAGVSLGAGFEDSNARLFDLAGASPRLVPAPIVVPDTAGETGDSAEFLAGLIERGARAVWMFPRSYDIPLLAVVMDALCRALEERHMPLFVERDEIDPRGIEWLCGRYPGLPVVVSGHGHWAGRWIHAMLESHANLHADTAPRSYTNQGIEHMVGRVGPTRLLFASDYPLADPAGLVAYLAYADISPAARDAIGAGNLERLLACVN